MRAQVARFAALLVAGLLLVAGCGSADHSSPATQPAQAPSQPMAVTAVQAVDTTHVRITAQVPAPTATCVRHLAGRVTDSDARTVFVQLTFDSPPPAVGRCAETASAAVVVAVPALRGRVLSVDGEAGWAAVAGSPGYRHCTGPFGCSPPPRNHCDPAWTTLAGHSGELQPERSYRVLACNQTWLVMNVDATVTGCQPLDGASRPTGCRVTSVRWFLRFDATHGWTVVASSTAAGCAGVQAQVSAFPTALCRRLPAR